MNRKLLSFFAAMIILASAQASLSAEITSADKNGATDLPTVEVAGDAVEEDPQLISPGTVSVIKPEKMKGEQKNLPELLKQVSGLHMVETRGRGSYTVASVRGSTAAQVSVFVDGTLLNLGSDSAVDLSAIPVEDVEKIEVYRGYVPSRFAGASMGGVINIITKQPEKSGGSFSAGAGSYGKFKTNISYGAPLGDGTFYFGANYEKADNDFKYDNDNGTPYNSDDDYRAKRQNNGYENSNLLLKWKNKDWTVQGSWKRNNRELVYEAAGADKPSSLKGAWQDTKQLDFLVSRRFKSGNMDWGIKVDYLMQDKKYHNPNEVSTGGWFEKYNKYKTNRFGAAIDGSLPIGDNHLIEFLADYANEKLDVDGDIIETYAGINHFSRNVWNIQLQDSINLNKTGDFIFTPIIRYNAVEGEGKFSFGGALSKSFANGWSVKLTGGKYNRAPNLYERYGDGAFLRPSTNLSWEDGVQWDLGFSWKGKLAKADIQASLTYFGRHSNNLIECVMVSSRSSQYRNIGKADIHGIEFETQADIDKWNLFLSATYMKSENKTQGSPSYGEPLPNRPKWEGLFRVSRTFLKDDILSAFAEMHYTGENYYNAIGTVKMDNLFTVGVGAKLKLKNNLRLILGVDDIFDKGPGVKMLTQKNGPERTMWYPLQGRTFYATLEWLF